MQFLKLLLVVVFSFVNSYIEYDASIVEYNGYFLVVLVDVDRTERCLLLRLEDIVGFVLTSFETKCCYTTSDYFIDGNKD